jgi:hypothetical protein
MSENDDHYEAIARGLMTARKPDAGTPDCGVCNDTGLMENGLMCVRCFGERDDRFDAGTPATDALTCRYCGSRMDVSTQAYAENPWCSGCLHERMEIARSEAGPGRWVDAGGGYVRWERVVPPATDAEFWEQGRDAQAEVDAWPAWKRDAAAKARVSPATDEPRQCPPHVFRTVLGSDETRCVHCAHTPTACAVIDDERATDESAAEDRSAGPKRPEYEPKSPEQRVAYLVEECGEVLAAAGKSLRWGLGSWNPELPEDERETNAAWLLREMRDLDVAIARVREVIDPAHSHPAVAELARTRADFANACDVGRRLEAELARVREERDANMRAADVMADSCARVMAERDEARRRADALSQVVQPAWMLLDRLVEEWDALDDDGVLLRTDYGRGEFEEMLDEAVSEARPILAKLQALPQHTVASTDQPPTPSEVTTSTMPRSAPVASEGEGPLGDGGIEE